MTDEGSGTGVGDRSLAGAPAAPGRAVPADGTWAAAAAPLVPDWLSNGAALGWRILVVAAVGLVGWYLLTLFWTVSAAVVIAIIVSAVFAPFVLRLRAAGRSRTAAAAVVWAVALLVLGAVLFLLLVAFLPYVVELAGRLDTALTQVQAEVAKAQVPSTVSDLVKDLVQSLRETSGEMVSSVVGKAAEVVTIMILAVFLFFFFLRDGDKAWLWLFQAIGDPKREMVMSAGDDALARVGGYLRGTTVLAALVAVTDYLFMIVLGVPLALPLALLAFLCGYIPYFGGIVATLVILLVTFGSHGATTFLVMLLSMGVRGMVLGYLVRPQVYGRTVSIHPGLVLLALPAGYQLAGVVGLFSAVPVAAVLIAVYRAALQIVEPVPPPALPRLVPAWLDRLAQFGWRLLVVVAVVAVLVGLVVTLPFVIIPLIVALVLAATLEPLVQWLMRHGRPRSRAAAIALGGGTLLIVAIMALAVASLVEQGPELAAGSPAGPPRRAPHWAGSSRSPAARSPVAPGRRRRRSRPWPTPWPPPRRSS